MIQNNKLQLFVVISLVAGLLQVMLLGCSPTSFPERLPLEGNWYFRYDPGNQGLENDWHAKFRPDSGWETVPLGAYWAEEYDGAGWYQQKIWLPALRTDRNLALVITSVSDSAQFWLNGEKVPLLDFKYQFKYADIRKQILSESDNLFVIQIIDHGGPGGLSGEVYIQKYVNPEELSDIRASESVARL